MRTSKDARTKRFEVFGFGPCVPNVYYHYAGFGVMPIANIVLRDGEIEADDKLLIDRIIAEKSALEPWDLASDCCLAGRRLESCNRCEKRQVDSAKKIKKEAQKVVFKKGWILTNDRCTR